MEKAINLNEQVQQINEILRGFGKEAIQEIKMKKDGKVIGQVKYGYRPQWVFDAVNQVIGAENWRYELVKEEIFDSQAVAEIKLFLKIGSEWLCKGSQKGNSQIVKGNVGDAQKGAITNALLKCFSLISVGSDAYKGLLEEVFTRNTPSTNTPAKTESSAPTPSASQEMPASADIPQNQTDSTGLPQIAGVTYEQQGDGRVIAIGKAAYDKRSVLKAAGFRFDGNEKAWVLSAA